MCSVVIGILFASNYKFFKQEKFVGKRLLNYFFFFGIFVAIHGIFVAESYVQWSYLVNVFLPFLMLPCFAILGANHLVLSKILRLMLSVTLPLSLLFLIQGPSDKQSNLVFITYVASASIFIILLPLLRTKWKFLVLLITIISFAWDIENRSNVLNISVSCAMLILYIFSRGAISKKIFSYTLRFLRTVLLFLPILLLLLGVLGVFNPFKYLENNDKAKAIELSAESGRNLSTDSRTVIYEDAFNNLNNSNDWIFGSSATVLYATQLSDSLEGYDLGRLGGSESGFIGVLTFGGIIYAVIFFLLCYHSSRLAILKSENTVIKLVGLYVAYKWFFSFIEFPLGFNFSWIVLFLAMGITFNSKLRLMSNKQIAEYFGQL
ncbi:MAG: hypothetical protein H7240_12445 [Glaciimonas sp.]|nr:hypothetical protein [Glaciimonas sp.]